MHSYPSECGDVRQSRRIQRQAVDDGIGRKSAYQKRFEETNTFLGNGLRSDLLQIRLDDNNGSGTLIFVAFGHDRLHT